MEITTIGVVKSFKEIVDQVKKKTPTSCPLCLPIQFKPTSYKKTIEHLKCHWKTRVEYAGKNIIVIIIIQLLYLQSQEKTLYAVTYIAESNPIFTAQNVAKQSFANVILSSTSQWSTTKKISADTKRARCDICGV